MNTGSEADIERAKLAFSQRERFMRSLYRKAYRQHLYRLKRGCANWISFQISLARVVNEQFNWRPR